MQSADYSKRYNQFSGYLENLFGCKVYKVTLDAGFDCPNRDGTISTGGCVFCDEGGSFSRAHESTLNISLQLEKGIENQKKRFKAKKFLSYLQAFSNTYGNISRLKEVYDSATAHNEVVGLSIGTRPDCINAEKINLIAEYTKKYHVWVEYGLQSSNNRTLERINRGHTKEDFINAVNLTKNRNINICAHVIIGLPGETRNDALDTAKFIADAGVNGVKIHLLCVLKNTELENMYLNNEFQLLSMDEYVDTVCDFLELIPHEITIHRIAGNGLREILVAPKWLPEKFNVLNRIDRELERRGSFQGKKC